MLAPMAVRPLPTLPVAAPVVFVDVDVAMATRARPPLPRAKKQLKATMRLGVRDCFLLPQSNTMLHPNLTQLNRFLSIH